MEANRECALGELCLVALKLGQAAILELKAVSVRLSSAAKHHRKKVKENAGDGTQVDVSDNDLVVGSPSSAVSLSTSNSELKLLRVLQMLNSLCDDEAKSEGGESNMFATLLHSLNLNALWDQLEVCLNTVSVLEGVAEDMAEDDADGEAEDDNDNKDEAVNGNKPKLQNSVAGEC